MKTKRASITRRTIYYYLLIAMRYKWALLANLLIPFAAVAIGDIAFRYYLAILFEQLGKIESIHISRIWHTFFLLMILIGTQVFLWRIHDYTRIYREAKTLRDMEQYVYSRLQRHSYRFFNDNFSGSLVNQFSRFIQSYHDLEDVLFMELLSTFATLIFSITILLFIAPILGLALLIWAILFIGIIAYLTIKKSPVTREAAAAKSKITANVSDVLSNMLNVKVFARIPHEARRFEKVSQEGYKKRLRSTKLDGHIRNVRWLFVVLFMFLYLYLSIELISSGTVRLSAVLAAQFYIMLIYIQLFNLNRTIERVEMAFSDAAEMTEILDLSPEIKDPIKPETLSMDIGLIEFHSVNFHYTDASNEVLTNFSLRIEPGQKVGLVGQSGSGKSTLTRLLMRFVDLQSGKITINGQNITNVKQDDLRTKVAYVPQEPILFHRSLMENIRYGRDEASNKEVYQAAQLAHAAEFIENMPDGYETLVGERGVKLSGGEKQRIAIARTMLSRSPILILDEATSALDSKSEKLITNALDNLMKNRTTIVIAHRLSTIRKMDRILVMKNGTIIEDGNHQSLLKQKGEYAELWAHQSGGFLED